MYVLCGGEAGNCFQPTANNPRSRYNSRSCRFSYRFLQIKTSKINTPFVGVPAPLPRCLGHVPITQEEGLLAFFIPDGAGEVQGYGEDVPCKLAVPLDLGLNLRVVRDEKPAIKLTLSRP